MDRICLPVRFYSLNLKGKGMIWMDWVSFELDHVLFNFPIFYSALSGLNLCASFLKEWTFCRKDPWREGKPKRQFSAVDQVDQFICIFRWNGPQATAPIHSFPNKMICDKVLWCVELLRWIFAAHFLLNNGCFKNKPERTRWTEKINHKIR